MNFVGIDPGKLGGIACVHPGLFLFRTPVNEGEYDIQEMKRILIACTSDIPSFVMLERAQAMPRFKLGKKEQECPYCHRKPTQGTASSFEFGKGYGIWIGLLEALSIKYATVHPQVWHSAMVKGAPGVGKDRSIWTAKRRFPEWQPRTKAEALALSDAILIAEYGRITQTHEVFSKVGELEYA